MLSNLGKSASKWVVRLLLGLLILSFALWGIGDYITAPSNPPVATVADREIRQQEFADEASRRIQAVQRQQNIVLQPRQALALGLYDQVLAALIDRATLNEAAAEFGLAVPDEAVARTVQSNPLFANEAGQFDPFRLQQVLSALGYASEQAFAEDIRGDLVRRQLEGSISAGLAQGPTVLARAVLAHQIEARDVAFIVAPNERLADAPTPSEDELRTYHAEHKEPFSTPELRRGRVIELSPAKLADHIDVSRDQIAQAYESRLAEFQVAASRTATQAIFDDQDAAEEVLARVEEGVAFDAAVQEKLGTAPTELGRVTEGELPEALNEAVFTTPPGQVAGPIETGFGWHLVHVTEATEARTEPLEAVRERVARDLKLELAADRIIELSQQVEDELAAGNRVADIAATLALGMREVGPIDRSGHKADGSKLEDELPEGALETLFRQQPGDDLELQDAGRGAYFVAEVTEVSAPALRPFEDVRDEVAAAWRSERLAAAAAETRGKLLERLKGGATLEELGQELDLAIQTETGVTRQGGAPAFGGELRQAVFEGNKDDFVAGEHVSEPSQVLARITAVTEPPIADDDQRLKSVADAIGQSFADDILLQYRQELRQRYDVSVNRQAMVQAVDPSLQQ